MENLTQKIAEGHSYIEDYDSSEAHVELTAEELARIQKALQLLEAVEKLEAWRMRDEKKRNWKLNSKWHNMHGVPWNPSAMVNRTTSIDEIEAEDPVDALIKLSEGLGGK
jgi:predicted metal-dependent hydrolase